MFFENNIEEKNNEGDFIDKIIYNYDIPQMKKIISYFEDLVNAMPKMNDIGKFLFIYAIVCSEIEYDKSNGADFDNYLELASLQRSLYGTLINGEGVCAGYSLVLYNLLSYVNINSKMLGGTAFLNNGTSGGHAWNAVEIEGNWYFVDPTWDASDLINLKNCLVINDDFIDSHQLNEDSQNELINCQFANNDYDRDFLKQCFYYLSKEYIIKNKLLEKLRSYRVAKKDLFTFQKYQEELLEGSWRDLIEKYGFDVEQKKK